MKITRQIVADKIADYLHGEVSQAELVDWAERKIAKNSCATWAIARSDRIQRMKISSTRIGERARLACWSRRPRRDDLLLNHSLRV